MIYQNRPVFEFPIDWGNPINKSFTYDLAEVDLGFGKPFFTSLQQNVVQGFEFTLRLMSDDAITAVDTFTAALNGRLVGFWLPSPIEALQIVATVAPNSFKIAEQGLASTWQDHPDVHLYFARNGISAAAKITAVVDNHDGTETVTLNQAVDGSLYSATSFVQRLLYVRLAEDVEQGTFLTEGQMDRLFRAVELPTEYAVYETGVKKVVLYHVWCDAPIAFHWYYTSFAADFVSKNVTYSAFEMDHGEYKRGLTLDGETLDVSAKYDPNHPFSLFLPVPLTKLMNIQVLETTLDAPDVVTTFFTGQVISVPEPGDRVIAHCESWTRRLANKAGRLIGPICPYCLYEPNTCKVLRARFETTAIITAVNSAAKPPTVTVSMNFVNEDRKTKDWFAQGFFETGFGLNYELRTVVSSTFDAGTNLLTLQLGAELVNAEVGDLVQLAPGCDGLGTTCDIKFNNFPNFGGFEAVPSKSPSLTSVQAPVSAGGKGK